MIRRGGWLALLALATWACGESSSGSDDPTASTRDDLTFRGAHLLLISIDTLRADRLGVYGYERGTTPHLDAFARESVVFEEMHSNSSKTASSHMSLFTSLLPTVHKVRNQSARLGLLSPSLADNRLTLAQILNRAGYWNAAVTGGANLNPEMGFDKGFRGRFEAVPVDVTEMLTLARDRIRQARASTQPGFVFLHTYQVHGPYLPPRQELERFVRGTNPILTPRVERLIDLPFHRQWAAMNPRADQSGPPAFWSGVETFGAAEAAYLSDLYDAEIAHTDAALGALFDDMRSRGWLDDTVVVILSDHGEEFFEHGRFEHDQLHREHLHVPFIMRLPGGRLGGTRIGGLASLIDVLPTLLELLDVQAPENAAPLQGTSLVPSLLSGRTRNLPVFAERVMFLPDGEYDAALRGEDSVVMYSKRPGTSAVAAFDRRADPRELNDVACGAAAAFVPSARERLRASIAEVMLLRDRLDLEDAGGTIAVDSEEQVANLQALGYVDGETAEGVAPVGDDLLDAWPADC